MNLQEFMSKLMMKNRLVDTRESRFYIKVIYKDFLGIKHWRVFDKETGERIA